MIVSRILQIIDYKGINRRKFYIETGLSNGFLDKVKDVGASKIEHILNIYAEINPEWLLTGKGNMLKSDNVKEKVSTTYTSETNEFTTDQYIPLYSTQTAVEIIDLLGDSKKQNPIEYIRIPKISICDGALYLTGDSMSPLVKSGDVIVYKKIVNPWQNIIWGEMYLIHLNNDGNEYFFARFLNQSEREEYVQFTTQNPHHQTVEFPLSSIKALALVKATIRINTQF